MKPEYLILAILILLSAIAIIKSKKFSSPKKKKKFAISSMSSQDMKESQRMSKAEQEYLDFLDL